jgi:hypothetical protein
VASLFIFYEVFGILTNLFGGYIGARFGLKTTLFIGLGTQLVALSMLAFAPQAWLVVAWVMASQALSGIAKDMTKMSSKSAVKLIVPEDASATLYRWVSILTGSKNALKGVGFFLGGLLLTLLDFQTALKLLVALVGDDAAPRRHADARRPRPGQQEGQIRPDVLAQRRGQQAGRGAHLPLRRARRLVRRRSAGLPLERARLDLLAVRRLPRGVGDRLRHRPGGDARPAAQPRRGAPRARRADGDDPRLRPRRAAGRHRPRAGRRQSRQASSWSPD